MEPSHNTEYGDMARGGVLIRKNERAYRGSERREQFHEFGAVVIRACTKTVDGHDAIMEFNNAICVLSLSLSLSVPLLSRCPSLLFALIVFQFLLLTTMRRGTVEQVHGHVGPSALSGSVRRLISH